MRMQTWSTDYHISMENTFSLGMNLPIKCSNRVIRPVLNFVTTKTENNFPSLGYVLKSLRLRMV